LIQQKSLGIAFVDFNTERDAENAKVEINGKLLYDRPLRAKSFVPYQPEVQVSVLKPSRRHSLFHRKFIKEVEKEEEATSALESAPFDAKVPEETEETTEIVEETVEHEEKEIEDDEVKPGPPPRPVSNNTVFIGHLSPRITDGDLRSFFHDYSPTNIYLFKRRAPKNKPFFKHRHVSGLVTLEVEDLSKVLEDMSDSKLKGRRVTLKPAYLTKIEEVKRAADVRQRILEKLGQEARDADSGALTASTEGVDSPKVSSEVASGQEQSSSPKAEDEAESEANSGEITKH
jgi:RNA recognition motif-containing protein